MNTAVLAYDLGGTKVAVGVVDVREGQGRSDGKILAETREPIHVERGRADVMNHLAELGKKFLREYPKIRAVGIASAGPLDPVKGVLLDPTNLVTEGKSWGQVPIARELSRRLKRKVWLDNDAAAAMLAEQRWGAAKKRQNAMILTLGTGLGTGIICNGKLVRSGRMLHPEGGHVILRADDGDAPCGCGNLGCAEAYLSGRNFTRRFRRSYGDPSLSGSQITELARDGNLAARAAFADYAKTLAIAIHNYVVLFSPEVVVLTGSFAEAADLFLEPARQQLEGLLARRRVGKDLMPKLLLSRLNNRAGILGGALVAHYQGKI
ncbi:MAG: ROK family protein [Bacteriovoracia bacterium]